MPPMYPQHQLIETGRATKSTLSVCVGLPNDLVDLSPFDFHFRMDRITKRCMPVEYLLMTGNARKDLKVRFVMGEGGGAQPECYDSFGSISFISQSTSVEEDIDGNGIQWCNVGRQTTSFK